MSENEKEITWPVLDFADALDRVEGDKDFYFELVDAFFSEYPVNLKRLSDAVDGGNGTELDRAAHYLKSALGNLSAKAAYHLAWALEKAGKANDLESAVDLLERFKQAVTCFEESASKERTKA